MGGHFFNKRYDLVVVFITLFLAWYILSWYLVGTFFTTFQNKPLDPSKFEYINLYYVIQTIGYLILFPASAVTGYFDSRYPDRQPSKYRRWITTICGVLLSGYATYLVVFQVYYLMEIDFNGTSPAKVSRSDKSGSSSKSGWFSSDVFFLNGTSFRRYNSSFQDGRLPDPPSGDAMLTGIFYLDDEPAPNLTFDMVLDGKYRAKQVKTSNEGIFSIPIQAGTWHVDYVHITAWEDKPADRDLEFVTGRESKLQGASYYSKGLYDYKQGLPVQVTQANQKPEKLKFVLRDKIRIIAPTPNKDKQKVTSDSFVIRWQQIPDAKHYLMTINEVKREGTSTSYTPMAIKKITNATQFALADLKTTKHDGDPLEYQVQLYAFDKNNNYLTESPSFTRHSTFVLADGKRIIDKEAQNISLSSSGYNKSEIEEVFDNKKRLDAVKLLIKEKLFLEAEALLKKVKGKTTPGEKEAITGYLLAEQNRCDEAEKYFALAKKASPSGCMPDCYRKNCAK